MQWYTLRKNISRKEAKLILACMQEIIDRYGLVTLVDFYDLTDDSAIAVYTDNKKGWRSLTGSRVSLFRKHGAYRLKLPLFEEIM